MTDRFVLDCSALVEYLLVTPSGLIVSDTLGPRAQLHLPQLCLIEVVNALRGLVLGRKMTIRAAEIALDALAELPATVHPAQDLLGRIWDLRSNVTAYDATYIALAEAVDATVLTADEGMARACQRHATARALLMYA